MTGRAAVIVAMTMWIALVGCVPTFGQSDDPVSERPQDEGSLVDLEQAAADASEFVTEVSASTSLDGLSVPLNMALVIDSGDIATQELAAVLRAVQAYRPASADMITIWAVSSSSEPFEPVSIGPQLVELGVDEKWIREAAYAEIPASVLDTVAPAS